MLDEMDKQIDAVTVATPDHTHAIACMDAIRRGKHVYCEKPVAVDVPGAKLKVFVLSAIFASVAGSLYANDLSFVSPDPFGLSLSVLLVVMVVVGGAGNIWGALLGAGLMTILGQRIEKTDLIKDFSEVVYGGVLILFVIFMPEGLAGLLRRAGQWIRRPGGAARGA